MKKTYLLAMLFFCTFHCFAQTKKPKVFVFTDINIGGGNPDDRQSLVYLFWYSNELEFVGIVPDRWNARGLEACQLVIDAYAKDYQKYNFKLFNFPEIEKLKGLLALLAYQGSQLYLHCYMLLRQFPLCIKGNTCSIKNKKPVILSYGRDEINRHIQLYVMGKLIIKSTTVPVVY
jgi:hypothetical protein